MSREAPPTLPGQLAAVLAASGLALAVQVPFFRSIVVSRLSREGGAPLIAAGTGLRAVMGKLVSAEIFWAHNFSNLDTTNEKTIQDNGIHFQLSIGWPK
jgi:hypothetical protein